MRYHMQLHLTMAALNFFILVLLYASSYAGAGQLESRFSELWVQGGNKSIVIGIEKHGRWRDYDFCRPGTYVYSMQLRTEGDQYSYWNGDPAGDDTAVNSIRLFCAPLGQHEPFTTVESFPGVWGEWGREIKCERGVMIGAKSRVAGIRKQGRKNCRGIHKGFRCEFFDYDDRMGITNVMMHCSDRIGYEGDGRAIGDWRADKRCPKGYAVCGIRALFQDPQPGWADDTALDAAELLCCPVKLVSCHPTDAWVPVMRCDNRRSGSESTCKYEQQVGTAVTKGESKTTREEETKALTLAAGVERGADALGYKLQFSQSLGKSKTTGLDWTKGQDQTFSSVHTTTVEYKVPARGYKELRQIIGTCGGATVATANFTFGNVEETGSDKKKSNETTTESSVKTTTEAEDEYRIYDMSRNWKKYGNHTLKGGKEGKGEWKKWEFCQDDMFAYEMILKTQSDQGGGDDTAVNAFVMQCAPLGEGKSESVPFGEIKSAEGPWGDWGKFKDCKESVIIGLSVRSGGVRARGEQRNCRSSLWSTQCDNVNVYDDQTGVNNVKALCANGKVLDGGGHAWGEFEPEQRCPAGYAICGMRVMIQAPAGDKDDTALEAVEVACCRLFIDDCTPRDNWDLLISINNTSPDTPASQSYSQTVGTTVSNTEITTKREKKQKIIETTLKGEVGSDKLGFKAQFSLTLGKSKETGFDWTKTDIQTFSKATTSTVSYTIAPKSTKSVEQLVGTCGAATVHTTSFRFVDDLKEEAEAVTAKSSNGQLVGGGQVTRKAQRPTLRPGDVNTHFDT